MSTEIINILQFLLDSPLVKWLLILGIASIALPLIIVIVHFVIVTIQFIKCWRW